MFGWMRVTQAAADGGRTEVVMGSGFVAVSEVGRSGSNVVILGGAQVAQAPRRAVQPVQHYAAASSGGEGVVIKPMRPEDALLVFNGNGPENAPCVLPGLLVKHVVDAPFIDGNNQDCYLALLQRSFSEYYCRASMDHDSELPLRISSCLEKLKTSVLDLQFSVMLGDQSLTLSFLDLVMCRYLNENVSIPMAFEVARFAAACARSREQQKLLAQVARALEFGADNPFENYRRPDDQKNAAITRIAALLLGIYTGTRGHALEGEALLTITNIFTLSSSLVDRLAKLERTQPGGMFRSIIRAIGTLKQGFEHERLCAHLNSLFVHESFSHPNFSFRASAAASSSSSSSSSVAPSSSQGDAGVTGYVAPRKAVPSITEIMQKIRASENPSQHRAEFLESVQDNFLAQCDANNIQGLLECMQRLGISLAESVFSLAARRGREAPKIILSKVSILELAASRTGDAALTLIPPIVAALLRDENYSDLAAELLSRALQAAIDNRVQAHIGQARPSYARVACILNSISDSPYFAQKDDEVKIAFLKQVVSNARCRQKLLDGEQDLRKIFGSHRENEKILALWTCVAPHLSGANAGGVTEYHAPSQVYGTAPPMEEGSPASSRPPASVAEARAAAAAAAAASSSSVFARPTAPSPVSEVRGSAASNNSSPAPAIKSYLEERFSEGKKKLLEVVDELVLTGTRSTELVLRLAARFSKGENKGRLLAFLIDGEVFGKITEKVGISGQTPEELLKQVLQEMSAIRAREAKGSGSNVSVESLRREFDQRVIAQFAEFFRGREINPEIMKDEGKEGAELFGLAAKLLINRFTPEALVEQIRSAMLALAASATFSPRP